MSKFKVGDSVKAVAECDHCAEFIGRVGEVIEIVSRVPLSVLVRFGEDALSSSWWCEEKSLELVPPASGMKHDDGKPRLDLVSPVALTELAKVLAYGAAKYGANNWRKGLDWSRPYAATQRHLLAWQSGEDIDPESGLPHLAHAMCNIMFLVEYAQTHNGVDDRWRK